MQQQSLMHNPTQLVLTEEDFTPVVSFSRAVDDEVKYTNQLDEDDSLSY